ncbi:hypothetical protein ONR75_04610 [Rhodopseudomonas sp. P2A-2r]|uniref:hypothetical protein n=1 Tax=Rhodopseudomonas sp. P2A-2r TaxID=2991972 RepID=UPI0022348D66|nr:hypothetical protein [Rhodopseudomonas sp. P2A-2r]UZE50055.1 hypothetical protein ONR75_04610 [Rhodopseudomonas sp. P2A-2r]
MTTTARFMVLNAAFASSLALMPTPAGAQWWTAAPADFEDCAERAERSGGGGDAKASLLADCEARFAGRRKAGGGYTYHDFMQNRSFDIAGPNPTAAEQRMIDEQYAAYLDGHRRSIIVAAFAEKQRQQQLQQQASLEPDKPAPIVAPRQTRPVAVVKPRPRPKSADCTDPLACGWSRLSSGLKDITKTLFGPRQKPSAARRSVAANR